ncbi:MAG TPA: response regulator [Burkholderiales bacterium]|nr:response regulator [Burkholderiales bacterium]
MDESIRRPILVIEDDVDIRDGLKVLLEDEGYAVELAHNGIEALGMLERTRPFVILLDVMMPIMDGRAFLKAMRQKKLANANGVPVIMLTAAAERPDDAPEVVEIVKKPIDFDSFLSLLKRLRDG